MRKFLFLFLFGIIGFGQMKAQSFQMGKSPQAANDKELIAYPNPAKDFLYLKTTDPNVKIKSATFYSILGNVVADVQINANYSEIRIDKLKQGRYLMRYVLSNNTQKIIQIIKHFSLIKRSVYFISICLDFSQFLSAENHPVFF